jgi:hypothetical protein
VRSPAGPAKHKEKSVNKKCVAFLSIADILINLTKKEAVKIDSLSKLILKMFI